MKDCFLGFVVGVSVSLSAYVIWEDYRHVPVIIKKIKVPVPVPVPMPESPVSKPSRMWTA
mgnify:CR=1 FL=1